MFVCSCKKQLLPVEAQHDQLWKKHLRDSFSEMQKLQNMQIVMKILELKDSVCVCRLYKISSKEAKNLGNAKNQKLY